MVITSHELSNYEHEELVNKRIKFIDKKIKHLWDTNEFMLEVDILLNDYSTTSTDFAILKRPQIFYMPDFEKYNELKGFCENYRNILPGDEINTLNAFKNIIQYILTNKDEYISKHTINTKKLLRNYYDHKSDDSCRKFSEFLKQLINE